MINKINSSSSKADYPIVSKEVGDDHAEIDTKTSKQKGKLKSPESSEKLSSKISIGKESDQSTIIANLAKLKLRSDSTASLSELSPKSVSSSDSVAAYSPLCIHLINAGVDETHANTIANAATVEKIKERLSQSKEKVTYIQQCLSIDNKNYFTHIIGNRSKFHAYIETGHPLGSGADKEVVKAVSINGKQVALAFVNHKEEFLKESLEKSQNEFNVGIAFSHSNLFIQTGEKITFKKKNGELCDMHVMEFCGKGSLNHYLQNKSQTLTEKNRLVLCTKLIEGVLQGHEKGYIFNDYKPENILIDNDENPKVIDFGTFAKKKGLTSRQYFEGTATYFPPECYEISKKNLPPKELAKYAEKKDIFQLGITLQTVFLKGEQSPLVRMKDHEKKQWCEKHLRIPSHDPLEEVIRLTLIAAPENRADDALLKKCVDTLKNSLQFYENNPTLSKGAKFSDVMKYLENIPFALKYQLLKNDDIKLSLEQLSPIKKKDQREALTNVIESVRFTLYSHGILNNREINQIISNINP